MATDERDIGHLFRNEGLVSDVDLRVDVGENLSRYVGGDEDIEVDRHALKTDGPISISRGGRTRRAGSYERRTGNEEMYAIGREIVETVHGGVHLKAKFGAESMIGGAYVNTIAGPYLRVCAWADFLVWGGWAEVDTIRCELSALMIRSHVGYAHAAGARLTLASRLIDDFVTRTETFGIFSQSASTCIDAGAPGGGITNEA